jgi:hypothetical protein
MIAQSRLGTTFLEATMQRFAGLALIPLCAGFLYAQAEEQTTRTETKTTTTTYNGTLVDAGCRTTQTANREVTTSTPERSQTTQTKTETTECPITTSTTSFGLMTSDGKFVKFDQPSNTRVIQVMKSKKWDKLMEERKPVNVRVLGTANGDVVVIKEIQ